MAASLSCSLNGALSASGSCDCFAPWRGPACGELDTLPHAAGKVPAAFGYEPNVTSWGGGASFGDDGVYHLLVTVIPGGNRQWIHNSKIVHAIADTPGGPYRAVDTPLTKQATNAAPVRAPKQHAACPRCWYLFHLGFGNSTSNFAHRATSPYGPWTPVPAPPGWSAHGCSNPAPAFDRKNGSLSLVCAQQLVSTKSWGWALYHTEADPLAEPGSWRHVLDFDLREWTTPDEFMKVEDPFLWQDVRGNWHLLGHRYDYRQGNWTGVANASSTDVLVSAHAFSPDLLEWHLSLDPPYPSHTTDVDGRATRYATLERPQLLFGRDGEPTHLLNGASSVWDQYSALPCGVCDARPGTRHSCVVCKTSEGYDWTFTLEQALRTGGER